jgi:hypothetical protein
VTGEPKLLESVLEASGLVALAVVLTVIYYERAFLKILLKKHYGLVVFAVVLTAIYCACYHIVASNPQIFLTEGSVTTYTRVPSSNGTSITIPLSQSTSGILTHWSWLNDANTKYVLNLFFFFASVFIVSYFKPVTVKAVAKKGATQKPQGSIKHSIEKAFAVYGLFVVFWVVSLNVVPVTPYDTILTLILVFVAIGLLAFSGTYLLVKTKRETQKRIKVGDILTVGGIVLAAWLVITSFLSLIFFPLFCFAIALLVALYFIVKYAKKTYGKIAEDVDREA